MPSAIYTAGYIGSLWKDDPSWSNVYGANTADGGGIIASGMDEWCRSAYWSGPTYENDHFFFSINTEPIDNALTIQKASVFIYVGGAVNTNSWNIGLYKGTQPDTTLPTSAYGSFTTLWGTKTIASVVGYSGWLEFVLSASGIADINKTGYTKYALVCVEGRQSSAPTGVNSVYTSVSSAPYLKIEWNSGGGSPMMFSSGGLTMA